MKCIIPIPKDVRSVEMEEINLNGNMNLGTGITIGRKHYSITINGDYDYSYAKTGEETLKYEIKGAYLHNDVEDAPMVMNMINIFQNELFEILFKNAYRKMHDEILPEWYQKQ